MSILARNCEKCPEKLRYTCNGNDVECMCVKCPRNLGECLVIRYCRETESVLEFGRDY